MEDKSARRKSWIKNIIIIFLAIMLLLTFFSNTIMNYSLPEVAVQYAQPGSITTRIRASGTVEANQNYELKMPETRTIADIGIRSGSRVQKGDVLFTLEAGESPDLTDAEKQLQNARIAYEEALLKMPQDFTSYLHAIEEAKEALEKAQAASGDVGGASKDELEDRADALNEEKNYENSRITVYTKQLSQNTSADNTYLYRNLDDTQLAFEMSDAEATAKSLKDKVYLCEDDAAWVEEKIEELTADKEYLQKQHDALVKKAGNELDDDNPLKGDYRTLEDKLTAHENLKVQKQRDLDDKRISLNSAYEKFSDAMSEMYKAQSEFLAGNIDEAAYTAKVDAMNSASKAYTAEQTAYNRLQEDVHKAIAASELEIDRFLEDLAEKESDLAESSQYRGEITKLSDEIEAIGTQITELERDKTDYEKALENANKNHADANDKYLLMAMTVSERRIKAIDRELKDINETISEIDKNANSASTVAEAKRRLSEAQNAYNRAKEQYTNEQKIADMRLEQQKKELDKLEEKYESLKGGDSITEITAPVSGVVSSVSVSIGNEVQMNSLLCTIQLVDRGYSVSFSVTNDQAKRIRVGDIAEPQYYRGGDDLTARVESITADQGNTNSKKITLNVTGSDVNVGRNMTFILGERSANYDIVVPKSALHEDSTGNFVLVVNAKSTPLGTRYNVSRADVEVVASDDTNAAVTGALNGYEYIITASATPITSGMQVRLMEN